MVHPDVKQEKVGIPKARIRKIGVFDLDKLYIEITKWYKKMGYTTIEKDTSGKRQTPLREFKFIFTGKRNLNTYFRYNIETEVWITNAVEVKIKGKKYQKARVEVTIVANYHKNYKKTFKIEWMRRIYDQIILKRMLKYEGKLFVEVISLKDVVKGALKMISA